MTKVTLSYWRSAYYINLEKFRQALLAKTSRFFKFHFLNLKKTNFKLYNQLVINFFCTHTP